MARHENNKKFLASFEPSSRVLKIIVKTCKESVCDTQAKLISFWQLSDLALMGKPGSYDRRWKWLMYIH